MKKNELQINLDLQSLNNIDIIEEEIKRNKKVEPKEKGINKNDFKCDECDEFDKEIELKSLYRNDINNINSRLLTLEEELVYFEKIRKGDLKAKKEFINFNLKLVISVANKYTSYSNNFSDLDIIQEGNIGLLNAISKYDPSKGIKFSTYAVYWINQSIQRALEDKTRVIRMPNHRVQQINRINKFINLYKSEHNEDPTPEIISEELGYSVNSIKKALFYNNGILSLNINNTEDKDSELSEIISDGFNLEEEVLKNQQLKDLSKCLNLLSDEEKEIIMLRFYKNYKISQIQRMLELPRTRINKILECALKKMKKQLVNKVS